MEDFSEEEIISSRHVSCVNGLFFKELLYNIWLKPLKARE